MRAAVRVLDSYSLIAYIEGEEGADKMIELFQVARDSGRDLLLATDNWGAHADCFAAALAKLHKAELVTGDEDFKQVEGEVKTLWIRSFFLSK